MIQRRGCFARAPPYGRGRLRRLMAERGTLGSNQCNLSKWNYHKLPSRSAKMILVNWPVARPIFHGDWLNLYAAYVLPLDTGSSRFTVCHPACLPVSVNKTTVALQSIQASDRFQAGCVQFGVRGTGDMRYGWVSVRRRTEKKTFLRPDFKNMITCLRLLECPTFVPSYPLPAQFFFTFMMFSLRLLSVNYVLECPYPMYGSP